MAGRAATPQGRKLGNINNMPDRRYLPSINFSAPFARWSHFYVSIDISKCKVIRYSRKKIITLPSYHIHNSALECLFQISDLGIILDSKLTFCPHIEKKRKELKQNVRLHGSSVYCSFNLVVGRKILWYFKLKILRGL
jgi:hypothetical protein